MLLYQFCWKPRNPLVTESIRSAVFTYSFHSDNTSFLVEQSLKCLFIAVIINFSTGLLWSFESFFGPTFSSIPKIIISSSKCHKIFRIFEYEVLLAYVRYCSISTYQQGHIGSSGSEHTTAKNWMKMLVFICYEIWQNVVKII